MAAAKRFTTEQIVAKLREAEKLQTQGLSDVDQFPLDGASTRIDCIKLRDEAGSHLKSTCKKSLEVGSLPLDPTIRLFRRVGSRYQCNEARDVRTALRVHQSPLPMPKLRGS